MNLTTPMVYSDAFPLHLDGLLYWAILQFMEENKVQDELNRIIQLTNGVYRASQALFVKSNRNNLTVEHTNRVTRTAWREYELGFSKSKKSIKECEGPFRKRLDTFMAIKANKIIFFAQADVALVQWYLNSLMGIGRHTNSGFGEIDNIIINNIEQDNSWFLNGMLNRVLPISCLSEPLNNPVRTIRYKPNYKTSEQVDCYIPLKNTYKERG